MIQYQSLSTNIIRIVWQTVKRITTEKLGVKWLKPVTTSLRTTRRNILKVSIGQQRSDNSLPTKQNVHAKFKSLSVLSSSPHWQYSLAALNHSFSYKINFLENIKTFKFCLPPNSIKRFTTMSYHEPFLYSHALTYSFLSTVPSFSSFHFISPSNIFSALSSLIMLWLLEILFVSVHILMKAYILC